jgi:hypothetical protein
MTAPSSTESTPHQPKQKRPHPTPKPFTTRRKALFTPTNQDDDPACAVCKDTNNGHVMLMCDRSGCGNGYHTYCIGLDHRHIPAGDWFCAACTTRRPLPPPHTHTHTAHSTHAPHVMTDPNPEPPQRHRTIRPPSPPAHRPHTAPRTPQHSTKLALLHRHRPRPTQPTDHPNAYAKPPTAHHRLPRH